jgi:hypothetical protein
MNRFKLIAIAAALGFAAAMPATAKVHVLQSPSVALARGSTFAWAPTPAIGYGEPDPKLANEVTADRLRAVTEITLTNKGYYQVANPAAADLLVAYTIVIQPERVKAVASNLEPSTFTQGTLVLDLVERRTGRLVWRATSDKRVTAKDVSQGKLVALLRKMTKSLPAR